MERQKKKINSTCRLCCSDYKLAHENVISDRGYSFDIIECQQCGFQEKASKVESQHLLKEVYGNLNFIERRVSSKCDKPEREYVGSHIDSLSEPKTILEVGPGAGGNLNYAKKNGHTCLSLDVSDDNNIYYHEVFAWDGVYKFWSEIESCSCDLVILTHVIEHVEDPLPFFHEAVRVLAANGEIILSTPNRDSLWARLFGRYWWPYAIDDHFSFFQPKHFRAVAAQCGLSKPKIWTSNMMSFLTIYRAWRPVRIKPSQQQLQNDPSSRRSRRILAKAISAPIEILTLPFSWFGLGYEIVVIMGREVVEGKLEQEVTDASVHADSNVVG